jgi:hypothetical protein
MFAPIQELCQIQSAESHLVPICDNAIFFSTGYVLLNQDLYGGTVG